MQSSWQIYFFIVFIIYTFASLSALISRLSESNLISPDIASMKWFDIWDCDLIRKDRLQTFGLFSELNTIYYIEQIFLPSKILRKDYVWLFCTLNLTHSFLYWNLLSAQSYHPQDRWLQMLNGVSKEPTGLIPPLPTKTTTTIYHRPYTTYSLLSVWGFMLLCSWSVTRVK